MSTKRPTSTESSLDAKASECSYSFQEEDNAKRARLVSLSGKTLQDLPTELLEDILITAVVVEVISLRLSKRVWKEKAGIVISRLGNVSCYWKSILTTNIFWNTVLSILEVTALPPIRLEIFQHSNLRVCASNLIALKDEIFVHWVENYREHSFYVYDLSDMKKVKCVIPLPDGNPMSLASCGVSNCVYLLNRREWSHGSVSRIKKADDDQFSMSSVISKLRYAIPTISVTVSGDLILARLRSGNSVAIDIYSANGSFQYRVKLPSEFSSLGQIIPQSNGNLVLVSFDSGRNKSKLTVIDRCGTVLRKYVPLLIDFVSVCQADSYGRLLLIEKETYRVRFMDSELHFLNFTGPRYNEYSRMFPYCPKLHYNSERMEVASALGVGESHRRVLTVLRFREE